MTYIPNTYTEIQDTEEHESPGLWILMESVFMIEEGRFVTAVQVNYISYN